jgi:hypothetical protein
MVGILFALGLLAGSGHAAGGPAQAVSQAFAKGRQVAGENMVLNERIRVGNTTIATVQASGIDEPASESGSFVYDISPAQPGVGHSTIIVLHSKVYIHYPLLDTLHTRDPRFRPWLVTDTGSTVDPAGFTSLGAKEVASMTDLRVVRKDSGITWYEGTLSLRKLAGTPQMKALLTTIPSSASDLLRGTEILELSIGDDGLIHALEATITAPIGSGHSLVVEVDVTLSKFDNHPGALVPPPANSVMTLAEFKQLTGTGASTDDAALLKKVVLKPGQVGSGFKSSTIPGGTLVSGETTLDFCGASYPSESLRTARLQVAFQRHGQTSIENEVVVYSPGGAAQALQEVRDVAASCTSGPVPHPPAGVSGLTRTVRVVDDPKLPKGSVAILEYDTAVVNGRAESEGILWVYQARGNVLSAVYSYDVVPADAQTLGLHAAEQSAANLKKVVSRAPTA